MSGTSYAPWFHLGQIYAAVKRTGCSKDKDQNYDDVSATMGTTNPA